MPINQIVGSDATNTLTGTAAPDLIYGFNPNGAQANVTSISATRVAAGLTQPVFATAPTGDLGHLYIVEKGGLIKILDLATGQVAATPFLNVSASISTAGERGLLGMAFDPDFATNGYVYVNLTNNTNGATEIRRYQVSSGNPAVLDPASATPVLTILQPNFDNHKGGWMAFGPDGYLYIASGDGGSGGDPLNSAQNMDSLLGKMLRVDVTSDAFTDPQRNYAIPSDNPFVGVAGADEIYALGLRNPWRSGFDRAAGDLYIADVGQDSFEEVNLGVRGANYGWRRYEGNADENTATAITGGTLTFPIHTYGRSVGQSITGGYVYRGESDGLQGQYFFADFVQNKIFTLRFVNGAWVATERTGQITANVGAINSPASFAEDGAGNLYVIDLGGEIFRLTPNATSNDVGDTLYGYQGDDHLFGGVGNDVLLGGIGADVLNGGAGADTASYADAAGAVTLSFANPYGATGEAAGDTLISIECLTGTGFNDTLSWNDNANILDGGAGNDVLSGNGGADWLLGGAGTDTLNGDADNDVLVGGAGADTLNGGGGADAASYYNASSSISLNFNALGASTSDAAGDTFVSIEILSGSAFNDTLSWDNAANILYGAGGDDVLSGNGGNDWLLGEAGNDTLIGGVGADSLVGGDGADRASYATAAAGVSLIFTSIAAATGDAAGDFFESIELITGSAFGDTLSWDNNANIIEGLGGNDTVSGNGGNDWLLGGNGDDTLDGGIGNDLLIGEAGNDTFVYNFGGGSDLVGDFGAGAGNNDQIRLLGFGAAFDSFADVSAVGSQSGGNAVFDFGDGQTLTLANVTFTTLTSADFLFV